MPVNVAIMVKSSAAYARNQTMMKRIGGTKRANISEMDNKIMGKKEAKD